MGRTGLLKQIINRQSVFTLVAAFTMMLPVFLPAFVSAAPISGHSITPSTPSISAPAGSVEYEVKFMPAANAAAFVIDFCTNSSLIGQGCDAPAGLSVAAATSSTSGVTVLDSADAMDANTLVVQKAIVTGVAENITFTGITNPNTAGAVYARIATYGTTGAAGDYESNIPGTFVDNGSVAMYFNTDISVSGTVLETMTFCVAGGEVPLTANCANLGSLDAPTIELGEDEGGVTALRANAVSSGVLQTQINTNAAGGVVIRLKSSADCGGLKLAGSPAGEGCHIAAAGGAGDANNNNIVAGEARFGVMPAVAVPLAGATGTYLPFSVDPDNPSPYYLTTRYSFNYDSGSPTTNGVTSTFGDPFLYTANAPATGQNMQITFGASIADNTPAGAYSTNLSMIAVGKF